MNTTDTDCRKERRDDIVRLLADPAGPRSVGEIVYHFRLSRRCPATTIRNDVKRFIQQGRVTEAGATSTGARTYVAVPQ